MDESEKPATAKITDEEKEQFFKSFLADKPYEAEDQLFGGKIKVAFRTLTVEEANDVLDQLRLDQKNDDIKNDTSYVMALTNYRLALSLRSFDGAEFEPEITKEKFKSEQDHITYVRARAANIQKWSVFKLSALAHAFQSFEMKIEELTKAIDDPGFWKAAE